MTPEERFPWLKIEKNACYEELASNFYDGYDKITSLKDLRVCEAPMLLSSYDSKSPLVCSFELLSKLPFTGNSDLTKSLFYEQFPLRPRINLDQYISNNEIYCNYLKCKDKIYQSIENASVDELKEFNELALNTIQTSIPTMKDNFNEKTYREKLTLFVRDILCVFSLLYWYCIKDYPDSNDFFGINYHDTILSQYDRKNSFCIHYFRTDITSYKTFDEIKDGRDVIGDISDIRSKSLLVRNIVDYITSLRLDLDFKDLMSLFESQLNERLRIDSNLRIAVRNTNIVSDYVSNYINNILFWFDDLEDVEIEYLNNVIVDKIVCDSPSDTLFRAITNLISTAAIRLLYLFNNSQLINNHSKKTNQ